MTPVILYYIYIFIWTVESVNLKFGKDHVTTLMRDVSIIDETDLQSLTAKVSISSTSLEHSVCSKSPLWKEWLCKKIAAMRVCINFVSAEEMDKSNLQFRVRTGATVILNYTNGTASPDTDGRCANISPLVLIEKLRPLHGCDASEEVTIDILNPGTAVLEVKFKIYQDWAPNFPLNSNYGMYTHAMVKAEYCHPMCILTMGEVSRNLTPIVSDGDIDKFVKWPTDQEVKAFYIDIPATQFDGSFVIDSLPSATSTTSSAHSSTAPSATTSTAHSSTAPSATTSSTTSSTAHSATTSSTTSSTAHSSTAPSATTSSTAHSSTAHSATPSIAHSSTAPSATTSSTGAILTRSISLLMCWIVL